MSKPHVCNKVGKFVEKTCEFGLTDKEGTVSLVHYSLVIFLQI